MEKSLQAVDIAAVTSGNKANMLAAPAENGKTTPFAQVLTPVQPPDQPGMQQDAGGNSLPGEQPLPAKVLMKTLLDEAGVPATSPDQAAVEATVGVASPSPDASVPVEGTSAINVTELPVEHIVIEAVPVAAPPADQTTVAAGAAAQVTVARQAAVLAGEPPAAVRENAGTVRDVAPGVMARLQAAASQVVLPEAVQRESTPSLPAQAAPIASAATAGDAGQVAVREAVQQAMAAQLAQDGLRQSLTGNARQGRMLSNISASTASLENSLASFSPVMTEVLGPAAAARVAVPVGEAGWARTVGEQVVWHVSQNIHAASLRLNPQHLGPLEMQVQMDGDRATLAFASQHAVVRDALESALPRLREMFAESGLDIVDVNVSQHQADGREAEA
ncbi:MAG: flagellar hook-length control protein FliK, partial [Thiohalobacterales bacterium]|nr:flagellar hook-length control protein FliK [Thiohalobacterales bacterium]